MAEKSADDLNKKLTANDESLKLGKVFKKDGVRRILKFEEEVAEYVDSGKAACESCFQMFSAIDGSHIARHLKERCKKRKIGNEGHQNQEKIRKIDGRSYNHMSSDAMQNFILDICNLTSSRYGQEAKKQLPSRQTIQKFSDAKAQFVIGKAVEMIKPYVGKRLHLLVDHGKLISHYLSILGSYIDNEFNSQIMPLGFTPVPEGRTTTGRESTQLIVKRLTELGIPKEEIYKCNVTADGALSTLGIYFNSSLASSIRSNSSVCANLTRLPSMQMDTL
uniref:Uncharacterized protein n=1 Tax=Caenorhabditis japonica TaxID=281687 RepID=A0A8R1E2Z0_CAEJA